MSTHTYAYYMYGNGKNLLYLQRILQTVCRKTGTYFNRSRGDVFRSRLDSRNAVIFNTRRSFLRPRTAHSSVLPAVRIRYAFNLCDSAHAVFGSLAQVLLCSIQKGDKIFGSSRLSYIVFVACIGYSVHRRIYYRRCLRQIFQRSALDVHRLFGQFYGIRQFALLCFVGNRRNRLYEPGVVSYAKSSRQTENGYACGYCGVARHYDSNRLYYKHDILSQSRQTHYRCPTD